MTPPHPVVAVIGAGPAGLIAAERLAGAGIAVALYDRMPGIGRKFLMAGRGGLNLTHSEPGERFIERYGAARDWLAPTIAAFDAAAVRAWCEGLGQPTFVGSSGRVFPTALKASPLLRAWRARLVERGVVFALRHEWQGWREDGALRFVRADGSEHAVTPTATLLALGGASWPRLGADGGWVGLLRERGVAIAPLRPANCGLHVGWSDYIRARFAGTPLKRIALSFDGRSVRGEAVLTQAGLEGGAVYALAGHVRDALDAGRPAALILDLRPDLSLAELSGRLSMPRSRQSLPTFLRKAAALPPVAIALLHEAVPHALDAGIPALAAAIKAVPLVVTGVAGLERAISTAGGIERAALDDAFMLKALPGVFAAGEMLDWEAPTGGYLLQACLATGVAAAQGIRRRLGLPAA
ncbi:MAG: TIGR03862 family flavoprotein [Alphaproteobacteria bacterium]|nr:TIGR03862 family flavoprotein [Alphaproteobacteria bacterium]